MIAIPGHPNLNLTPEEKRVYGQLLKEADPEGFGAVSGDVAVKFFERTKLPPDVLGQVSDLLRCTKALANIEQLRLDLADCRHRESRFLDSGRLWSRSTAYWPCTGGSGTLRPACDTEYASYERLPKHRC